MPHQIASLKIRHQEPEEQIREEMKRPLPDEIILYSLKREKLQIKDAISKS